MAALRTLVLVGTLAVTAACGPGLPAAVQPAAAERPASTLIAGRLPQIGYLGGRFLRHPQIVTITFAGDDPALVARLTQFGDTITRTPWWREVTAGYCATAGDCVGDGRPGRHVVLERTPPPEMTEAAVADLLAAAGPVDRETVLALYLPAGTALIDAAGHRFCQSVARAEHRALDSGTAYAVVPRCGDEAALTTAAGHEILEATTNPDPSHPGFAFRRTSDAAGFASAGVEPADPCNLINADPVDTGGFRVPRAWSDHAAALGHDPCAPADVQRPYLALVPAVPVVQLTRAGQAVTIDVSAAADRPVSPWSVSTTDLTGGCTESHFDRSTVRPGETAHLTVTLRRPNDTHNCAIGLQSTLDGQTRLWPLAVSTR